MDTTYEGAKRGSMITGSIALLLLLVLVSFLGSDPALHMLGLTKINATMLFVSRLLYWLCAALLWLYAHKVEQQDLLLRKEQPYPFSTYIVSAVLIFLTLFAGSIAINLILKAAKLTQTSSRLYELVSIFRQNTPLLLFTSLTAGVTEELMFRGYLQTRFEKLFNNPYIAIFLSSLLFGLLHYRYGTIANVLVPFFIGFVFAIYYWKYRNIKVLIVCHFLWDLIASYLLIKTYHA